MICVRKMDNWKLNLFRSTKRCRNSYVVGNFGLWNLKPTTCGVVVAVNKNVSLQQITSFSCLVVDCFTAPFTKPLASCIPAIQCKKEKNVNWLWMGERSLKSIPASSMQYGGFVNSAVIRSSKWLHCHCFLYKPLNEVFGR